MGGSLITAYRIATSVTASMKYSQGRPTSGISTPTSSGPTITPILKTVMPSAFAAGTMSIGTIRGMIALRVGWFTAKKPCWTASSASTSQTDSEPDSAPSHSPMLVTAMPTEVIISSLRRS